MWFLIALSLLLAGCSTSWFSAGTEIKFNATTGDFSYSSDKDQEKPAGKLTVKRADGIVVELELGSAGAESNAQAIAAAAETTAARDKALFEMLGTAIGIGKGFAPVPLPGQ